MMQPGNESLNKMQRGPVKDKMQRSTIDKQRSALDKQYKRREEIDKSYVECLKKRR